MNYQTTVSWIRQALKRKGDLRRQLAHAFAGLGALKFFQLALGLVTSIILARSLGVEGYGNYTFVFAMISLLALPAYAGLPPLLVREVARYDQARFTSLLLGVVRRAHQIAIVLGLLIMLSVFGATFWNASWRADDQWTLLALAAIMIPVIAVLRVRCAVLQGHRKVVQSQLPEFVVRPITFLAVVIGLLLAGYLNPGLAIAGQVVAAIAALCTISLLLPQGLTWSHHNFAIYDDRRWRASFFSFSTIAAVSYLNTDLIVPLVGFLASETEVAQFRVALTLGLLVGVPLNLVETTIYPHIVHLYGEGEIGRLFRMVSGTGLLAMLVSLPIVIAFGIFGRDILELTYGNSYLEAYFPLLALVTGFTLVNIVGPSMQLLYATGYEIDALIISLLSLILLGALSLIMIPTHGALGGATAFAIGKVFRATAFRTWAHIRLNKRS